MFEQIKRINQRPKAFEYYTAETLWTDKHISKKMLEYHLNEDLDPASRNKGFIDRSVEWMISRFDIGQGTKIADFGCGPGFYTTPFSEMGAEVTGIDFSERSLSFAKGQAKSKGLDINYVHQNYLHFASEQKFDLISLIYCDFCPLSPEQRKVLLGIFHEHLEEDGALFLDVVSLSAFNQREDCASYEHKLLDGFWSPADYYGFLNAFSYEEEKVGLDKYTIVEASRTFEVYNWLQYYSRDSIREEFAENGFQIVEYYGDVAGAPFVEDSKEFAVVAKKL